MNRKQQKGFTIIEVVLVLAIAGLIFLIVFLALPALQKSQRDTQRKNDIGRLMSAVQSFQGNNRGQLPKDMGGAAAGDILDSNYLDNFADPSGGDYTLAQGTDMSNDTPSNVTDGELLYYPAKDCDNNDKGSRTVAVLIALEGGGTYCQNI